MLATGIVPCEDEHAQERSLPPEIIEKDLTLKGLGPTRNALERGGASQPFPRASGGRQDG